MSTKPIDEFLQDCTVWLEKIAAAKQREEAAYAAIDNVQMEKKAWRALARGAGHFALGAGRLATSGGRFVSRLGTKLLRAGAKPKPITLQNPLAKQVSVALKSGKPQPKLVRNAKGDYVLSQPTKAPAPTAPAAPAAPATPTAPAPANAPVAAPNTKALDRVLETIRVSNGKGGPKLYSLGSGKQLTAQQTQQLLANAKNKFGLAADDFIAKLQARGTNAEFTRAANAFRAKSGLSAMFDSKMRRLPLASAHAKPPVVQSAAKPAASATPAQPATPTTPVEAPKPQPASTSTATTPQAKPATQPQAKTADPAAKVDAPKGQTAQGTQAGANTQAGASTQAGTSTQSGASTEAAAGTAGAEGAVAQPSLLRKAAPYALIGGAGFLVGRNTAPEPEYTSPAMVHNNMVYQQNQQAATPNIY